jgi:hypothetical protein
VLRSPSLDETKSRAEVGSTTDDPSTSEPVGSTEDENTASEYAASTSEAPVGSTEDENTASEYAASTSEATAEKTASEYAASTSEATPRGASGLPEFTHTPDVSEIQGAPGIMPLRVQSLGPVAPPQPMAAVMFAPPTYERIGVGGQAEVYRCSTRDYVIKMFKPSADHSAPQREIAALKALSGCEGVVQLLGRSMRGTSSIHGEGGTALDGVTGDQLAVGQGPEGLIDFTPMFCLLLEEAKGGALWTVHNREGPLYFLDSEEAAGVRWGVAVQLCRAVSAVHQRGWAHLDLHPGQAHVHLRRGSPIVKLLDFGGAHQVKERVEISTIWGNCRYISSMLVAGATGVRNVFEVSTIPDCYSLALTVFFVLTGIRPYQHTPDNYPNGTSTCDFIWGLRRQHMPAVTPEEIASLGNWEPVADVLRTSLITNPANPATAEDLTAILQGCSGPEFS